MLEQRARRIELGVRQVLNFRRQARGKFAQRSANAKDRGDFRKRFENAFAAELGDELLPALAVAGDGRERLFNGRERAALEIIDQPIGLGGISGGERGARLAEE